MLSRNSQLYSLIITLALLTGCAGQKAGSGSDLRATGEEITLPSYLQEYPPRQKEDLLPVEPRQPLFYKAAPPLRVEKYQFKTTIVLDSATPNDEQRSQRIVQGYRVQVFAGNEREFAQNVQNSLLKQYELSVYMTFEPPQYKVRIGDYVNRSAAVKFCDEIKSVGFRDAWVVRAQVTISK